MNFFGTMKAMLSDRDSLELLARAYLKFLITRDPGMMKPFLSLDFVERHNVAKQLKIIKGLPKILHYGLNPEIQLFESYAIETDSELGEVIRPFQFQVIFRNLNNPLIQETLTVTVHCVRKVNSEWILSSAISREEIEILVQLLSHKDIEEEILPRINP